MKNIVILISGRGSNMISIVEACEQEQWNARIVAVISNNPNAAGLFWAQNKGIETLAIDHKNYSTREDFDHEMMTKIDNFAPDLIVLAGFMRILTPGFVTHYEGRIINIHPSLLPLFPGLNTHQRALDAGHTHAGVTVHRVTAELDHGPILGQVAVPIFAGDTEEDIAARVLIEEHQLYPQVIRKLLKDMES